MREIKGPEDCIPMSGFLGPTHICAANGPGYFTASEVGQIIALCLEAGEDRPDAVLRYEGYTNREAEYQAWRELSERLKGM